MNRLKRIYRANAERYPLLWRAKNAGTLYLRRKLGHVHERDFLALRLLISSPDPTFVDIGANHGQSITSMRSVVPNCAVVAFEPNPVVAKRLKRSYRNLRSVDIHAVGLSDHTGDFVLHMPVLSGIPLDQLSSVGRPDRDQLIAQIRGYGFSRASARNLEIVEMTIPVRTLDGFGLRPDFIKVDVEGHEKAVIVGAQVTIEQCKPHLLIERGEHCSDLLVSLGYHRHVYEEGRIISANMAKEDHFNSYFIHETKDGF